MLFLVIFLTTISALLIGAVVGELILRYLDYRERGQ